MLHPRKGSGHRLHTKKKSEMAIKKIGSFSKREAETLIVRHWSSHAKDYAIEEETEEQRYYDRNAGKAAFTKGLRFQLRMTEDISFTVQIIPVLLHFTDTFNKDLQVLLRMRIPAWQGIVLNIYYLHLFTRDHIYLLKIIAETLRERTVSVRWLHWSGAESRNIAKDSD